MEKYDIEKGIDLIDEFVERIYPCSTDEDEYLIRKDTAILFGKLMELYGDHAGVACIMTDMAFGSMREMDGAASDVARDYLAEFIELTGITPEEVSGTLMDEASLLIYGKKDAFIF